MRKSVNVCMLQVDTESYQVEIQICGHGTIRFLNFFLLL